MEPVKSGGHDRGAHTRPGTEKLSILPVSRGAPREETSIMGDAIFVGVTIGFFGLTWALIRLCERL